MVHGFDYSYSHSLFPSYLDCIMHQDRGFPICLLFVLFSSCVPAPLCDWAGMRTARLTLRLGFRALAARARPPILTMASSAASDRANAIADNLRVVLDAAARASPSGKPPRVVAVSKTKPVEDLQAAYDAGQRWFAENYVQEICLKSPMMPADVGWRFIGHLQSNKVKLLLESVPSLQCIETVDTEKLANKLNTTVQALGRPPLECFFFLVSSSDHKLSPDLLASPESLWRPRYAGIPDYDKRYMQTLAVVNGRRRERCRERSVPQSGHRHPPSPGRRHGWGCPAGCCGRCVLSRDGGGRAEEPRVACDVAVPTRGIWAV